MRLLGSYARDALKRASLLNCWASDKFLASDDLVRPFKRIDEDKAHLEKLRHDTVFDKSLQAHITKLEAKIASNEKTLDRLEKECAAQGMTDRFCLQSLKEKLRFVSEQIEHEGIRYGDRTLKYRQAATELGDASLADKNPNVMKAKEEHDARVSDLREEYSKTADNIENLDIILKEFLW